MDALGKLRPVSVLVQCLARRKVGDPLAKIILLVLGLLLAYAVLQSYRRRIDRPDSRTHKGAEDMVRCERCGIHLPRSEGLLASGKFYCSIEHRQQAPKPD